MNSFARRKIKQFIILVPVMLSGLVFLAAFSWWPFGSDRLKADEEMIFLPTSASLAANGGWQLPLHAWIFELEDKDLSRRLARRLIGELAERAGVPEEETRSDVFRERVKYFLVDNQRGKRIRVSISSLRHSVPIEIILNKSAANGHTYTEFLYKRHDPEGSWLTLSARLPKGDQRSFIGQIKLIPPEGLSVICDIDDTIKVSNVLDKRELLRNILFRPQRPVRSMAAHLHGLERKGAYFHYVSASPWQLYPSLRSFMDRHVPRGTVSLRNFRIKDKSFIDFLQSSRDYKINTISQIIKRYPRHRYHLIGDSGEHDPEVYGEIARRFAKQVKAITIRRVEGADNREERFKEAFKGIPAGLWQVRQFKP